jgi:membrane-bound serine protease (ClpP class)
LTPLRPVGTAEFMGRRVESVAEGIMIERGEHVRVIAVQGNRVVVRKIEPEEMNFIPFTIDEPEGTGE